MASGSKSRSRNGLGAGRLLGIFFLLAVLMGVVFTLGYLLGRGQYDPQLRAAVVDLAGAPAEAARARPTESKTPVRTRPDRAAPDTSPNDPPAPAPANWDFYHAVEPAKATEKLTPQPDPEPSSRLSEKAFRRAQTNPGATTPASAPSASPAKPQATTPTKPPARSLTPPLIPRGSITLQVAALAHESDAIAMAQTLRQKKFPAFVLSPDADKLYRVQVGPYADAKAANAARERLQKAGFKTITKR